MGVMTRTAEPKMATHGHSELLCVVLRVIKPNGLIPPPFLCEKTRRPLRLRGSFFSALSVPSASSTLRVNSVHGVFAAVGSLITVANAGP